MTSSSERFSERVADYIKHRPGYPAEVLALLTRECGLGPATTVADIGSGTGIFTKLLLQSGAQVFAVEPNTHMRAAAEAALAAQAQFVSLAGEAGATTLPTASIDLITAAQAFHWFDRQRAREEFLRILKPGGYIALIWNEREVDTTPFLQGYEQLLKDYAPEYDLVDHRNVTPADIAAFFYPHQVKAAAYPYQQRFDYAGLKGRLLSSSYAPPASHPNHEPMLRQLRTLFDRFQDSGQVVWHYQTHVFYGRID